MTNVDETMAHIKARELVKTMESSGVKFDRKLMRFNDIVEEAMNHQQFAQDHSFDVGLREALLARVPANASFSPHGSKYPGFEWTGCFDERGLLK